MQKINTSGSTSDAATTHKKPRASKKARGQTTLNTITRYAFLDVELVNETEELREKIRSFIATNFDAIPYASYQMKVCKVLYKVECTDSGNSMRLHARYGRNLRYVKAWGEWYIWNGRVWAKDTQHMIMEYAKVCASFINVEADCLPVPADKEGNPVMCPTPGLLEVPTPEEKELIKAFERRDIREQELRKWSRQSRGRRSLEAAIELLKSEPGITVDPSIFDACDHLLNCRNGTFDLHAGELLAHSRENFITKIANVEYIPGATCPLWETFMLTAMQEDQQSVDFIKELVGEGLSGEKLDDILAIFYGPGGNGKSVHEETLKEMLGDYAATADSDLFLEKKSETISNGVARLVGVRFLTASETKEGRGLDESLVKQLTGGDTVTARFLRQEFFEFTPRFTPILLTNPKPIIRGTDNGIWRRVKLVPWLYDFENSPERKDKSVVLAELRQEHTGILNWAIAGYQARIQRGKLFIPEIVEASTTKYRQDSDTLGEFLTDYCFLGRNEEVTKDALYTAYKDYAEGAGHHVMSKKTLAQKLQERPDLRGLDAKKSGSIRYWLGIRLRKDTDPVTTSKKDTLFTSVCGLCGTVNWRLNALGKNECVTCHEKPATPAQPELSGQEDPPEEEAPYIPLPGELTMYPYDIAAMLQEQGIKAPFRPCSQHRGGTWLPYYNEGKGKWQYECSDCNPALHSSNGSQRYFSDVG